MFANVEILKLVRDQYSEDEICAMTKISYFGKQNSILGSVVPLAMFFTKFSAFGNIFFDYPTQSMVSFYLLYILCLVLTNLERSLFV